MKTTELKKEGLNLHLQITIPSKTVNDKVSNSLKEKSKTLVIKGFRAGNVPLNILQKRYGAEIKNDVVQHEIDHAINHAIKDNKLNIASRPIIEKITNETDKDLEFSVKFELMPEFSLPNLSKITIEEPKLKTDDKDVEEYLKTFLEASTRYEVKPKGKAKKGDQVVVNTEGSIKGKIFPEGTIANHPLVLGSNAFIPSFEDQLIGAEKDAEIVVKVTFPKDYHETTLAGQKAEFKVNILEINQPIALELNEEFFKKFNCTNLEEFKAQLAKIMQDQAAEQINTIMKKYLFDKLEKELSFEIPQSLFEKELSNLKQQAAQMAREENDTEGQANDLDKYYEQIALRRVRIGLMLSEYAKQKNLTVEINDLKSAILAQARNYPGSENIIIEFYNKNPQSVESLKGVIIENKAVDHIFKNEIKLTSKDYSKSEIEKLIKFENDKRELD